MPHWAYIFFTLTSVPVLALELEVLLESTAVSFIANFSLNDYGALNWCRIHNVAPQDLCAETLMAAVPETKRIRRDQRRVSLLAENEASSKLPDVFPAPHACSDEEYTPGRCILATSISRLLGNARIPGDVVEVNSGGSGEVAVAVSAVFKAKKYASKRHFVYMSDVYPGAVETLNQRLEVVASTQSVIQLSSFQDHAVHHPQRAIGFLWIDSGDYAQVLEALRVLYDRVPTGGFILLDDFGSSKGARKAFGDFFRHRQDEFPLVERFGPSILWFVKNNPHNRGEQKAILDVSNNYDLLIEVDIDDGSKKSAVFVADFSVDDHGAEAWCQEQNLAAECTSVLRAAVSDSILNRDRKVQSLIQGNHASYQNLELFPEPYACTDNLHTLGRCMLYRDLAEYTLRARIPGDFLEAGVHVGDSAAAVGAVFQSGGAVKRIWLYDSFQGMPEAVASLDGAQAIELSPAALGGSGWGAEASAKAVTHRLNQFGVSPPQLNVQEGWFNETFPQHPDAPIAFLNVDCDWYGSVLETLNTFYDRVPHMGVVMLDDFGYWEGARRAFGDFLKSRPDVEMPIVERYGADMLWFYKGATSN